MLVKKIKAILFVALSVIVFVGCTSSNTNGGSSDTASTQSSTSLSSAQRPDQTLEDEGVKIELYNQAENEWTYVLTTDLPNPCYSLEVEPLVAESFPEQVTFNVVISEPASGVDCVQAIESVQKEGNLAVNIDASFSLKVRN